MIKIKYYIKLTAMALCVLALNACGTLNPAPVQPYINHVFVLPYNMAQSPIPEVENIPYFYPAKNAQPQQANKLPQIQKGTRILFLRYYATPFEGYLRINVKPLDGAYAGRVIQIDQDTLLKCLNIKKVKYKFVTYHGLFGKPVVEEFEGSPF